MPPAAVSSKERPDSVRIKTIVPLLIGVIELRLFQDRIKLVEAIGKTDLRTSCTLYICLPVYFSFEQDKLCVSW